MGSSQSVDLDNQRIAEIVTEANGQFSKDFQACFRTTVINKIKHNFLKAETEQTLLPADTPWQNIKVGVLYKMGANVKSWKKRFFVAKNKSDNYSIIYYEDEACTKEKGRFCCCGYHVEPFTSEEESWYGPHGIKLTSYDDDKRKWFCRAMNELEQAEWFETFMNACKKSLPEPLKDPVYAEAFKNAFRLTKAAYGYFGVCVIFGTEQEMLEHLCTQILKREIVDEFIIKAAKNSSSSAKTKNIVNNVHTSIRKIVKPIVASTWRGCFTNAENLKPSLELTVKASLRQILDTETQIRDSLQPKMHALVDPFLEEYQSVICEPLVNACFEDIVAAHEQAIHGFYTDLHGLISSVLPNAGTVRNTLVALEQQIDQTTGYGPLAGSQRILWAMHTEHLVELQEEFDLAGMAGYDVYIAVMDSLRVLLKNAIFTFGKIAFATAVATDAARMLASVIDTMNINSSTAAAAAAANSGGDTSKPAAAASTTASSRNSSRSDDQNTVPAAAVAVATTVAAAVPPDPQAATSSSHKQSAVSVDVPLKLPAAALQNLGNPGTPGRSASAAGTHSDAQGLSGVTKGSEKQQLMRILIEVTSRLAIDAKSNLKAVLISVISDALEARVQETIIVQSYDEVLSAQPLVERDTKALINLESIGEDMVRDLIHECANRAIQTKLEESSSRLNVMRAQLIGET